MPRKLQINLPTDVDDYAYTILPMRKRPDQIVFVHIDHDDTADNPCEHSELGQMFSFNRRHNNYLNISYPATKEECEELLRNEYGNDIVILGYFEHGNCSWHISGHKPVGTESDYRWDGVSFAGMWVPSDYIKQEADEQKLKGARRIAYMEDRARSCCNVYTEWCNGNVFGFTVNIYAKKVSEAEDEYNQPDDYRFEATLAEDSCWGYYGWDEVTTAAKHAALDCIKEAK